MHMKIKWNLWHTSCKSLTAVMVFWEIEKFLFLRNFAVLLADLSDPNLNYNSEIEMCVLSK